MALTDEDREEIRAMIREEIAKIFKPSVMPLDTDLDEAIFTGGIYSGPQWTDAVGCESIGINVNVTDGN
jgi:hypothetical protein